MGGWDGTTVVQGAIMISGKAERTCGFHLFSCGFHQDIGTSIKMIDMYIQRRRETAISVDEDKEGWKLLLRDQLTFVESLFPSRV